MTRPATIDRQRVVVEPRRALNREEAARYVGIGVTKFDQLVQEGKMPKPVRILQSRLVWDIRQLDLAFDRLSGNVEAGAQNEWDRL